MKKIKSIGLLFLELVLIYNIILILEFGFNTPKILYVIISFLICMGLIPLLVHEVKENEREEEKKEKLIKISHETYRLLLVVKQTYFDTDIDTCIKNIGKINKELNSINKKEYQRRIDALLYGEEKPGEKTNGRKKSKNKNSNV